MDINNLPPCYKKINGVVYWNEEYKKCLLTHGYTPGFEAGQIHRPTGKFLIQINTKKAVAKEKRQEIKEKKTV